MISKRRCEAPAIARMEMSTVAGVADCCRNTDGQQKWVVAAMRRHLREADVQIPLAMTTELAYKSSRSLLCSQRPLACSSQPSEARVLVLLLLC
jgi:hypothetical protein